MAFTATVPLSQSAYSDLYEGAKPSILRLRQLSRTLQENSEPTLWPLVLVNTTTCMEWFARSVIKHLIDYSADQINPEARILKDLKINVALIFQANVHQFSIGDIVAISRNFSSFDDIENTIADLTKKTSGSALQRARSTFSEILRDHFDKRPYSRKALSETLNTMFEKRHELVHGSPRHLSYEGDLMSLATKSELLKYVHCCLEYIEQTDSSLRKFNPQLNERSTSDINLNQLGRLENSDREIQRLEIAISKRISGETLVEFRKTQRAWRLWRKRESIFQTSDWGTGTGRGAVLMGYQTSFNMQRLRSLEAYLKELDRMDRLS